VQGASAPKDLDGQEARRACSECLWLQRLKRRVGASWSSCARGPPMRRNRRLWPRSWLTGASCIRPRLVFLREREREKKEILLVCNRFPYLLSSLFLQGLFWGGASAPVSQMGSSRAREVESIAVLASIFGDAEGLVHKVALLKGQLTEAHWAWEKAEEKVCNLWSSSAEGARWLVAFEMEHREQFGELSLLRAWGAELCLTILGPSALVKELIALQAAVSSTVELVLGRPPGEASRLEVMNELTAKF
jgi:hypothetical protein